MLVYLAERNGIVQLGDCFTFCVDPSLVPAATKQNLAGVSISFAQGVCVCHYKDGILPNVIRTELLPGTTIGTFTCPAIAFFCEGLNTASTAVTSGDGSPAATCHRNDDFV